MYTVCTAGKQYVLGKQVYSRAIGQWVEETHVSTLAIGPASRESSSHLCIKVRSVFGNVLR